MQNMNEMISAIPSMARPARVPMPAPMPSPTEQSSLIIGQVIPQILQFISRELPIKQNLEDSQALQSKLVDLIDTLNELVHSNNTPKFTQDVADSLQKIADKINSQTINVASPTEALKAVEDAVKSLKFEATEEVSVNNLNEVVKAINDLKPFLVNLETAMEYEVEGPEEVILDKDSKKYLKFLEKLDTDEKNPLSVRLTDGKAFYKAVDKLNDGMRAMTGSSGNNFLTSTGSPAKANLDGNGGLKVTQDNYTVKIVYASAGHPQYIAKSLPGTAVTAAGWQIQKLTYSTDDVTDVQWAGGSLAFDKIFNSYASYTYS